MLFFVEYRNWRSSVNMAKLVHPHSTLAALGYWFQRPVSMQERPVCGHHDSEYRWKLESRKKPSASEVTTFILFSGGNTVVVERSTLNSTDRDTHTTRPRFHTSPHNPTQSTHGHACIFLLHPVDCLPELSQPARYVRSDRGV